MVLAMIYPEPEKGGRGNKSEAIKSAETSGFTKPRRMRTREKERWRKLGRNFRVFEPPIKPSPFRAAAFSHSRSERCKLFDVRRSRRRHPPLLPRSNAPLKEKPLAIVLCFACGHRVPLFRDTVKCGHCGGELKALRG
jgi:hypothetical protein